MLNISFWKVRKYCLYLDKPAGIVRETMGGPVMCFAN